MTQQMHGGEILCENPECAVFLDADHITLITTHHVRRFCSMKCVERSHHLAQEDYLERLKGKR